MFFHPEPVLNNKQTAMSRFNAAQKVGQLELQSRHKDHKFLVQFLLNFTPTRI